MSNLNIYLNVVRRRITELELRANKLPGSVTLVAVTKGQPLDVLTKALSLGLYSFGESYIQEAIPKIESLALNSVGVICDWHFIGPMQSNKTKWIARYFNWVHSLDRFDLALRLSNQRPLNLPPLQVCLQVNMSGEIQKSGCAPDELDLLVEQVAALPRLRLRGLMTIPSMNASIEDTRHCFHALSQRLMALRARGIFLDTLSMGMSQDFDLAIEEGATMVRIGSSLFGERTPFL